MRVWNGDLNPAEAEGDWKGLPLVESSVVGFLNPGGGGLRVKDGPLGVI